MTERGDARRAQPKHPNLLFRRIGEHDQALRVTKLCLAPGAFAGDEIQVGAIVGSSEDVGGVHRRIIAADCANGESDGCSIVLYDGQLVAHAQFIEITEHARLRHDSGTHLGNMPGRDGNPFLSGVHTAGKPPDIINVARYFHGPVGLEAVILKTRIDAELRDDEADRISLRAIYGCRGRRWGSGFRPRRIGRRGLDRRVDFPP